MWWWRFYSAPTTPPTPPVVIPPTTPDAGLPAVISGELSDYNAASGDGVVSGYGESSRCRASGTQYNHAT